MFESDGRRSTGERTQAVNTRFPRKRTGSFRSIRKRLSVQRRSTFGIGDSRPDDEHSNEQLPKVSGGDDEAEKEKAKKKTVFFKRKPKKEKVDRRSSEPLGQVDKVDMKPVKRHSENRLHGRERIGQGQGKAVACASPTAGDLSVSQIPGFCALLYRCYLTVFRTQQNYKTGQLGPVVQKTISLNLD